mgnify:CR=1 FL=1
MKARWFAGSRCVIGTVLPLGALLATLLSARADTPEILGAPPADRRLVCIRGGCFDAELAVTADERSRGLMYRDALPPDRGMLFVFPEEGRHRFWMKNPRIELDIVFIGADRRVVSVVRRATPCRKEPCEQYAAEGPAGYALEIAGGLAARHGIAAGDPVEFREPTPSRRPGSGTP